MKLLLVGADENNSTDGVIVKGIRYLLNRSYPGCEMTYIFLNDHEKQYSPDFKWNESYDLIVVCGTPWLWDNFQRSIKYDNLITCFGAHNNAKRLFMGIGSCLPLGLENSGLLERPAERDGIKRLFENSTVIVRDKTAKAKLDIAGIKAVLLPCPAFFCYGEDITARTINDFKNVLVYQDPTLSISADQWQCPIKLAHYYNTMEAFRVINRAEVYCANQKEIQSAINNGFPAPQLLRTADDTLDLMRSAYRVLSGRVHCAIPAIVQNAEVTLIPLDSRASTIDLRPDDTTLSSYNDILQSIFAIPDLKVGTEAQQSFETKEENGFFKKYMSGESGLDIGYAGYEMNIKPILPTAIGLDINYPGYDGINLPFKENSQDYVYSSHCLEHIILYRSALKEWHRVTKIGGHIIIIVPHKYLYEKKDAPPSLWNEDHKRFYTPASLLNEVETSLEPNTYRIRLLEDGDRGFDYRIPPNNHSGGQYEITLVIEKIQPPLWNID